MDKSTPTRDSQTWRRGKIAVMRGEKGDIEWNGMHDDRGRRRSLMGCHVFKFMLHTRALPLFHSKHDKQTEHTELQLEGSEEPNLVKFFKAIVVPADL